MLYGFVCSSSNETIAVHEQLFDVVVDIVEDINIGGEAPPTEDTLKSFLTGILRSHDILWLQTLHYVPVLSFLFHMMYGFVCSSPNETVAVREQLFDVVVNIAEDIGGEAPPTGPEVEQLVQAMVAVVGTVL